MIVLSNMRHLRLQTLLGIHENGSERAYPLKPDRMTMTVTLIVRCVTMGIKDSLKEEGTAVSRLPAKALITEANPRVYHNP